MKKIDLSVIVPCYNEEKNIPLIVERFAQILPKNIECELVLVDNGSTDNSSKVINELTKKHLYCRKVTVKKNIGYGFGIWNGLKAANGEFICWTHADMQTDLKDTIRAYRRAIKSKTPKKVFVKGKRHGRPLIDRLFTNGMSVFETLLMCTALYDINAQPNLFHRTFLKNTPNPPKDFSFDLYFYYIAKKKRYDIQRFPVIFTERLYGSSHWNTDFKAKWKFIKRTIDFSLKLRRRL